LFKIEEAATPREQEDQHKVGGMIRGQDRSRKGSRRGYITSTPKSAHFLIFRPF